MEQSTIENEYVKFWLEDDIIFQQFKPKLERITLTVAKLIVKDRQILTKGSMYPLFVDVNNAKSMDKEARDYFATEESIHDVSIAAFYIDNYVAWLGGSLFLAFNKPAVKVELFKNRVKAIEWLRANKDFKR